MDVPTLAPVVETPVIPNPAPVVNEPDLMTKITQFKKPVETTNVAFDYKEIEGIKDQVAKEIAIKAYKSMQSDYTKKTQEIAEQRKSFEQKLQEAQTWSPERIQKELLNN